MKGDAAGALTTFLCLSAHQDYLLAQKTRPEKETQRWPWSRRNGRRANFHLSMDASLEERLFHSETEVTHAFQLD
jgi:hypothetical protein